jgi:hypothetical protein
MKTYIGTKIIRALPMSRIDYNNLRGWTLPADENGDDAGYLVEYLDGGKPNMAGFAGYVSWSPAEQFDNAYRPTNSMTFGAAIEALKKGFKVARAGWNGKGMWLVLASGWNARLQGTYTTHDLSMPDDWVGYAPFIAMFTADKVLVPWLASQTDMLAEDWSIA